MDPTTGTFVDIHSGYKFCMKIGNGQLEYMTKNGINEYELIKWCEQFITPGGTFVDIGAHMGTYSVILSKICKNVICFEPQKDIFYCLNRNININGCSNVIAHNVGIGSNKSIMTLNHISEDGGGSSFINNLNGMVIDTEQVEVTTLDSFNINNLDFMKIDVEGYELEVIMGALDTLARNKYPPFIFECWDDEWYKESKQKILSYVSEIGYSVLPIAKVNNMYLATNHISRRGQFSADNFYNNAHQARTESKHLLAYQYAKKGLDCCPSKDLELLLHEEISIVAYYIGKLDEGYKSCDKVIFSELPFVKRNNALKNQGFYMNPLPIKRLLVIELPKTLLREYLESSSSMIHIDGGFRCNVRLVNYSLTDTGGYHIRDKNNFVRTRNILVTMDENLNMLSNTELHDMSSVKKYPKNILGMEDIRLFGNNEFFCTYLEVNENCTPQICYGKYLDNGEVTHILPLSLTENIQCEKNWIPFIQDNELYFLYTINPLHICKLNRDTGQITTISEVKIGEGLDFRGSSCLIPYNDGWLCTIHQVHYADARLYFHRFMWFSNNFLTIRFGKAFYFRSVGIEYNLSICLHEEGLLVLYSEKDNTSKIALVDYETLDSYLQ